MSCILSDRVLIRCGHCGRMQRFVRFFRNRAFCAGCYHHVSTIAEQIERGEYVTEAKLDAIAGVITDELHGLTRCASDNDLGGRS